MTKEELLHKSRNNDLFAQYLRACRVESLEEKTKRREEVSKCQHEFIMLKPAEYYGAFHSSDCTTDDPVIECVHCGLTNKFIDLFPSLVRTSIAVYSWDTYYLKGGCTKAEPFESELFQELINIEDISLFGLEKTTLNTFAKKNAINSNHIGLLFTIAKQFYPNATDEELFEVMKELNNLETSLENVKLETLEEATELIERYKAQPHLSRKINA